MPEHRSLARHRDGRTCEARTLGKLRISILSEWGKCIDPVAVAAQLAENRATAVIYEDHGKLPQDVLATVVDVKRGAF